MMSAGKDLPQTEIAPDVFRVDIAFTDLAAEKRVVLDRLGYGPIGAPAEFNRMVDEVFAAVPALVSIRAGYCLAPVSRPADRPDGLIIGGRFFHTHAIVAAEFREALLAAVFLCTIGDGLETWSARLLRENDPAQGYIVDCAASEFAERTAEALHERIAAEARRRGLGATNRYSPGYCNWPVAEQHALFSLLPEGFCGVSLTESALMRPIKSVSGIIGAGPEATRRPYRCDRCGAAECVYRNIRLAENRRRDRL